jgi:hypothetical protein
VVWRHPTDFSRGNLLEKAAACERALDVVTNPEYRAILRHLQKLWRELAEESPAVLKIEFAGEISVLCQLQTEMCAAGIN